MNAQSSNFKYSNLKLIRKVNKVKRESIAEYLGIKTVTYSKLERGEIKLTVDRLYEIAAFHKVEPIQILNFHLNYN